MSTTTPFNVFKESVLPAVLEAHSVYFVGPASQPDLVEIFVTGSSASIVRRVLNQADIQSMISSAITANGNAVVVADIAARNALLPLTAPKFVHVLDATADTTVAIGGATYLYDPVVSQWYKIAAFEDLDLVVNYNTIVGRPSATAAAIDNAVAQAHTHANLTSLNKITESAQGNMLYNNVLPTTGWSSTNW
jgi:hypothetical protein